MSSSSAPHLRLLQSLLTPAIRLCLRRSIMFYDFVEIAKRAFVDLAEEELQRNKTKINASRVNLLTGIYRHDIARITRTREAPLPQRQSLLAAVIGHWEQSRKFKTKRGQPRILSYGTEDSEFHSLVRSVSSNINPTTVLLELERSGAVQKSPHGVKLIRTEQQVAIDEEQLRDLLSRDLNDLVTAVEDNIQTPSNVLGNLHLRTEYDNIYVKDLPAIRTWLLEQGRDFHRRIRQFLSGFDKDVSPDLNPDQPAGGRVSVTAFSLSHPPVWEAVTSEVKTREAEELLAD